MSDSDHDAIQHLHDLDMQAAKNGDYAFEWSEIRGTTRHKETSEMDTSVFNVMRILQKNADGEWKVHRAIWNDAS